MSYELKRSEIDGGIRWPNWSPSDQWCSACGSHVRSCERQPVMVGESLFCGLCVEKSTGDTTDFAADRWGYNPNLFASYREASNWINGARKWPQSGPAVDAIESFAKWAGGDYGVVYAAVDGRDQSRGSRLANEWPNALDPREHWLRDEIRGSLLKLGARAMGRKA